MFDKNGNISAYINLNIAMSRLGSNMFVRMRSMAKRIVASHDVSGHLGLLGSLSVIVRLVEQVTDAECDVPLKTNI